MDQTQQPDFENEQPDVSPWYRNPTSDLPYWLYRKFALDEPEAEAFRTFAFFPWNDDSLQTLWNGSLAIEDNLTKWKDVVDKFRDAIAIGCDTKVYIVWLKRRKHPLVIKIPEIPEVRLIQPDTTNVAWALSPNAIEEPLLIFSKASLLWIYNPIRKGLASYLRGHGGAITSLTVHPSVPNLFCSTSRDQSARIYDLTLTPHQGRKDRQVNPHWPPGTLPSRAGAPHGLHMNESEGNGIGRCIMVLMGSNTGGHAAAVLNASFHPHYPVIATCGVDRCVKIWHVYPRNNHQITREDKPLFSSSRIHRSRVLSVRWVSHDTLVSHSPSAIMRDDPNDVENRNTHLVPGEIVVWRWLGLDRFFPPLYDNMRAEGQTQRVLRGCASDYQESASFTMMGSASFELRLQLVSPILNLYQSPTHDPLALYVIPSGLPFYQPGDEKASQTEDTQNTEDDDTTTRNNKAKGQGKRARNRNESASVDDPAGPPTPPDNAARSQTEASTEPGFFLPPDETPTFTKVLPDGKVKKYAGTVTIVHIPSLPCRIPSRFPLDKKDSTAEATPAAGTEQPRPALSGLSAWNHGFVERDPPPPITGWSLDVPLDEQDLAFEPENSQEGDAMEVDSPPHAAGTPGANQHSGNTRKGKRREKDSSGVKDSKVHPTSVRIQTAAMGMNGKVIVVLGTRGRIWVYRVKNG